VTITSPLSLSQSDPFSRLRFETRQMPSHVDLTGRLELRRSDAARLPTALLAIEKTTR
jgi:hypothetical protein